MRQFLPSIFGSFSALFLFGNGSLAQAPSKILSFDEYKNTVQKVDIKPHTINLEALRKIHGKKDVYLLDLRSESQYKQGHIKGALHLGADIKEERLRQLVPDKNATIVMYCSNTLMPTRMISLSYATLPQVIAQGYPHVFMLEELWKNNMGVWDKFSKDPLWEDATTVK